MRSLLVHIVCWLLKVPLTTQQKTKLVGAILASNNALPLRDVIDLDASGKLLVQGEYVDFEKASVLRDSASGALDNQARKYVLEQVASLIGRRGIAEGDTPDKLIFYRAALWCLLQQEEYLKRLAGK